MVVLEGLLGSWIGEPPVAEVVEVGDEATELAAVDTDGIQLILVVLRERATRVKK